LRVEVGDLFGISVRTTDNIITDNTELNKKASSETLLIRSAMLSINAQLSRLDAVLRHAAGFLYSPPNKRWLAVQTHPFSCNIALPIAFPP
jgi:hypothetical protein